MEKLEPTTGMSELLLAMLEVVPASENYNWN